MENNNSLYQGMGKAAIGVAKSLGPKRGVNLNQFQNLNNTISSSGVTTPSNNPAGQFNIKSLGAKTTDYGGSTNYEKFHPGLDIANKIGTNVPAFTGGVVVEETLGKKQGDKGFGNTVVIKDDQGNLHRYSHLSKSYVKIGDRVKPGQVFSQIGNTGSTYSNSGGTGSHLDYRIKDAYGKYVNPYKFVKYS